jgi:hypothetical protein
MTQPTDDLRIIAETEHYLVWIEEDDSGELNYHVDLEFATLHLLKEEWDELVTLMDAARGHA